MNSSVSDIQHSGRQCVWGVPVDWSPCACAMRRKCVWFLCKIWAKNTGLPTWHRVCAWVTLILLSGSQQPGQMAMLLASFVIFCALRKEQEGAKQLRRSVPSLCPSSPYKSMIVLGRGGGREDKSSGTKEELYPMGLWRRAQSSGDFVCDAYSEAGRTSLQAFFFFIRKIKIIELLHGH